MVLGLTVLGLPVVSIFVWVILVLAAYLHCPVQQTTFKTVASCCKVTAVPFTSGVRLACRRTTVVYVQDNPGKPVPENGSPILDF